MIYNKHPKTRRSVNWALPIYEIFLLNFPLFSQHFCLNTLHSLQAARLFAARWPVSAVTTACPNTCPAAVVRSTTIVQVSAAIARVDRLAVTNSKRFCHPQFWTTIPRWPVSRWAAPPPPPPSRRAWLSRQDSTGTYVSH